MCIDGAFKRVTHPFPYATSAEELDECDLSKRLVPSKTAENISAGMKNLVKAYGIEPLSGKQPCTIILNSNAIVATPDAADGNTCAQKLSDPGILAQARTLYPEKFVSNLYADADDDAVSTEKPVVLLEAYWSASPAELKGSRYVSEGVDKYIPQDWSSIVAVARSDGDTNNDNPSDLNRYIPDAEPTLTFPGKITVPVRELGWAGDADLLDYSKKFLTGFCRVEVLGSNANNCAYNVKAQGVNFPDGKSCVSNDPSKRQRFAAQYDCAPPKDSTGAPDKVAACLLRRAFAQGLCYPPAKANYQVQLIDRLKNLTHAEAFAYLKSGVLNVSTVSTRCRFQIDPLQVGITACVHDKFYTPTSALGTTTGADVSAPNATIAWKLKQYPFNTALWLSTIPVKTDRDAFEAQYNDDKLYCMAQRNKPFSAITTAAGSYPNEYLLMYANNSGAEANAKIIAKTGNTDNVVKSFRNVRLCKDNTCDVLEFMFPYWFLPSNYTTATYDGTPMARKPLKEHVGDATWDALQDGNCELPLNPGNLKGDEPFQQKPLTCKLLAEVSASPQEIEALDPSTQKVATYAECRDAFSANLDQLCRTTKHKLVEMGSLGSWSNQNQTFFLYTSFQDQLEELTRCNIDLNGSVLAQERAPASASDSWAGTPNSCEVLVGSANKRFIAKTYRGVESLDSCKELAQSICTQIDENVVRTLRTAGLSTLAAANVYARVNGIDANGLGVMGSEVQVLKTNSAALTCDLTATSLASTAKRCIDPDTHQEIPCGASCELFATSKQGNQILIGSVRQDPKTATTPWNLTTCEDAFKPYTTLCEGLHKNAAIRKENAAVSWSSPQPFEFKSSDPKISGKDIPLMVRLTPASGISSTSTPYTCTSDTSKDKGTLCELLVDLPNGPLLNMDGGIVSNSWRLKDLRSKAETDLAGCKARFFSGISGHELDRTCYGLSNQIGKLEGGTWTIPGLKGTSTTPLAVTLTARFRSPASQAANSATVATLGTCSYRADGTPTVLKTQVELTAEGPIITDVPSATDAEFTTPAPQITDLTFNDADPRKFSLKVKYDGPRSPTVPYTHYMVSFPSSTASTSPEKGNFFSELSKRIGLDRSRRGESAKPATFKYALPGKNVIDTIGPFDLSLLGGSLCQKSLKAVAATAMIVDSTSNTTQAAPTVKLFSRTLDVPCPTPNIQITELVVLPRQQADKLPTFTLKYKNVGGAPGPGHKFLLDYEIKYSGTGVSANDPKEYGRIAPLSTPDINNTLTTPAQGMNTHPSAKCPTSVTMNVSVSTTDPLQNVAPLYNAQQTVQATSPCPPVNIEIKKVEASNTRFWLRFVNVPGIAASGQTVKFFAAKSGTAAPKSTAQGSVPVGTALSYSSDFLFADLGITTCGTPVNIDITTSKSAASYKYTATLTPPCPLPNIQIAKVTVVPKPAVAESSFNVEYVNVGASAADLAHKFFDLMIVKSGTTAPQKKLAALTVLAKNIAATTPDVLFSEVGVTQCGTDVSLDITTTSSVTNYKHQATVKIPCLPNIKIASVIPDASGSFKVEYKNVGGPPSAKQTFDLMVYNSTNERKTTLSALPVPTLQSGIGVRELATGTGLFGGGKITPLDSSALQTPPIMLASLGMTCGVVAKLEITTPMSSADNGFKGPVTVPCPPDIKILAVEPDTQSGMGFAVVYENVGGAPTKGQTFDLSVANLTAGARTELLKLEVPRIKVKTVTKMIEWKRLEMACGGKAGDFEIRTTRSTRPNNFRGLVTPPACPPPKIAVASVIPGVITEGTGRNISKYASIQVEYKNVGGSLTAGQTFAFELKANKIINNSPNSKTLSALKVPNAGDTLRTDAVRLESLGAPLGPGPMGKIGHIGCGEEFLLEITPQQIAGVTYGPVKTTIPCP